MAKNTKILVVGSFVMDLIVTTPKFPAAGETVLGTDFSTAPGGKGANQAIQAARLGADVTMVGKLGQDAFGDALLESMRGAGVDVTHVARTPHHPSAIGNIQIESVPGRQSANRIIVVSGANMQITDEDIAFLHSEISAYDMVLLQFEIPMYINEAVAKLAHDAGVPVMLNPAPSAPISDKLMSNIDYLSPNEHEAYDLTGVCIRKDGNQPNFEDIRRCADVLLSRGCQNVLITLGECGAVLCNSDTMLHSPCARGITAVDPTAAGDSFIGSFCTCIGAGMSAQDALFRANHTAALTVSKQGAQPSLPTLAELNAFIQQTSERRIP